MKRFLTLVDKVQSFDYPIHIMLYMSNRGLGQLLAGQLLVGQLRADTCSLGQLLARTFAH